MCAKHEYIVPGLDVLIGDPSILYPHADEKKYAEAFFIPENYVHTVISFYDEQSGRGDSCRELVRRFGEILSAIEDPKCGFILKNGTVIFFIRQAELKLEKNLNLNSSRHQTIMTAKYIQEAELYKKFSNVAIMTGSDTLATLAALYNIDVVHVNPEVYTGRRKVVLSDENSGLWYSNHKISAEDWTNFFPKESPLRANEFVEFVYNDFGKVDRSFVNIGRFVQSENALLPLRYFKFKSPRFNKIWPKTAGQAMLLEALLAPPEEIPLVVVSGTFGTGKTFLSVAAGYFGVSEDSIYERIFICPRDGALGAEIGFVPGDATEKTLVKSKPIIDNLRSILKLTNPKNGKKSDNSSNLSVERDCADKHVDETLKKYFEFEPVIFMGGRSIENSFIIYDEFQDMERYQAKALLSRIGNNSKIIVSGDPSQLTNPHLNRTSNGLSYSASKLAGRPEAAIITLNKDEIVRSPAAIAIAECFK